MLVTAEGAILLHQGMIKKKIMTCVKTTDGVEVIFMVLKLVYVFTLLLSFTVGVFLDNICSLQVFYCKFLLTLLFFYKKRKKNNIKITPPMLRCWPSTGASQVGCAVHWPSAQALRKGQATAHFSWLCAFHFFSFTFFLFNSDFKIF